MFVEIFNFVWNFFAEEMETRAQRKRIILKDQTKTMGKLNIVVKRLTKEELQAHGVHNFRSHEHPQNKIDNIQNASEKKSITQGSKGKNRNCLLNIPPS